MCRIKCSKEILFTSFALKFQYLKILLSVSYAQFPVSCILYPVFYLCPVLFISIFILYLYPVSLSWIFILYLYPVSLSCIFILYLYPVSLSFIIILYLCPVYLSCIFILYLYPVFLCCIFILILYLYPVYFVLYQFILYFVSSNLFLFESLFYIFIMYSVSCILILYRTVHCTIYLFAYCIYLELLDLLNNINSQSWFLQVVCSKWVLRSSSICEYPEQCSSQLQVLDSIQRKHRTCIHEGNWERRGRREVQLSLVSKLLVSLNSSSKPILQNNTCNNGTKGTGHTFNEFLKLFFKYLFHCKPRFIYSTGPSLTN